MKGRIVTKIVSCSTFVLCWLVVSDFVGGCNVVVSVHLGSCWLRRGDIDRRLAGLCVRLLEYESVERRVGDGLESGWFEL